MGSQNVRLMIGGAGRGPRERQLGLPAQEFKGGGDSLGPFGVTRLRIAGAGFIMNNFHCDHRIINKRFAKDKL
jgi:hypothetical protein